MLKEEQKTDDCKDPVTEMSTGKNEWGNDYGRLITRKSPCSGDQVKTYQDEAFLAWDPAGKAKPPGEKDPAKLKDSIRDLVIGSGQLGCGYESQNESWYRFLVDPNPYGSIALDNQKPRQSDPDRHRQEAAETARRLPPRRTRCSPSSC